MLKTLLKILWKHLLKFRVAPLEGAADDGDDRRLVRRNEVQQSWGKIKFDHSKFHFSVQVKFKFNFGTPRRTVKIKR